MPACSLEIWLTLHETSFTCSGFDPVGDRVWLALPIRKIDRISNIGNSMTKSYLEAAVEIAREAGKVLREELDRPLDIAYKGEFDLVTQADRRSEAVIVGRLQEFFPDHSVAAEEGTGKDTGSDYRWHVDPLDGTTNFAHGYPCFCVSMALAHKNELLLGVVYNPVYDELFAAARGEGATLNGKKIHCSKIDAMKNSLLCTGFPNHDRHSHPNIHYYWDFTLKSHGVRRDGSAALDLASVAAGRFDGFWEFGLSRGTPPLVFSWWKKLAARSPTSKAIPTLLAVSPFSRPTA